MEKELSVGFFERFKKGLIGEGITPVLQVLFEISANKFLLSDGQSRMETLIVPPEDSEISLKDAKIIVLKFKETHINKRLLLRVIEFKEFNELYVHQICIKPVANKATQTEPFEESFLIPLMEPTNCEKFHLCKQGRFLLGRVVNYFREFYINKAFNTGTFQVDRTIFATSVVTGVGIHTAIHHKNYGTGVELECCNTNEKLRLKRLLLAQKILYENEEDSDGQEQEVEDVENNNQMGSEESPDNMEEDCLPGTSKSNIQMSSNFDLGRIHSNDTIDRVIELNGKTTTFNVSRFARRKKKYLEIYIKHKKEFDTDNSSDSGHDCCKKLLFLTISKIKAEYTDIVFTATISGRPRRYDYTRFPNELIMDVADIYIIGYGASHDKSQWSAEEIEQRHRFDMKCRKAAQNFLKNCRMVQNAPRKRKPKRTKKRHENPNEQQNSTEFEVKNEAEPFFNNDEEENKQKILNENSTEKNEISEFHLDFEKIKKEIPEPDNFR